MGTRTLTLCSCGLKISFILLTQLVCGYALRIQHFAHYLGTVSAQTINYKMLPKNIRMNTVQEKTKRNTFSSLHNILIVNTRSTDINKYIQCSLPECQAGESK